MIEASTAFYNNLDEAFAESWRLLSKGSNDRKSGFHHATVASIGQAGQPNLRTVILRSCDPQSWSLRFHTDFRSTKVDDFRREARVSLLFYDPAIKIQLRLVGQAHVHHAGEIADAAWQETRIFSRQCYGIQPGPGSIIPDGGSYYWPENSDAATTGGRSNFCAIVFEASSLEWLYLASSGHRRAYFEKTTHGVQAQWLAP